MSVFLLYILIQLKIRITWPIFLSHIQFLKSSEDSKNNLDTKSEILGSLKDLKSNKTPGYDGLPVEFYVVFFMIYSLKLLPLFFSASFYV